MTRCLRPNALLTSRCSTDRQPLSPTCSQTGGVTQADGNGRSSTSTAGNNDDVVPRAVWLVRGHVLIEFVDQANMKRWTTQICRCRRVPGLACMGLAEPTRVASEVFEAYAATTTQQLFIRPAGLVLLC